jgi:HlyD family secretion protein
MSEKRSNISSGSGKRRRWLQWAVIFSAGILLIWGAISFLSNDKGPAYRTDKATRGELTASVTATGSVNAVTTVLVGTQVSGTIRNIYVDFNSSVKKGQLIAQIDPDMFEAQAEQARANVMKAAAQMRDAERTLKRNQELFSRNLIPRSDLDTSETNFESARAGFELAKAAFRVAETNLKYTKIISPVDGVVISRNVDVGQTVAASFQTPTLFTIAQDLTKMQVDANVAESDIGMVKTGQQVNFSVDAYPDITFEGKVSQIRRAPITVQNVVTYNVVIRVNNRDFKLMPGMTANVSVIVESRRNVLKVPNAALRFKPSDQEGAKAPGSGKKGPALWVLESGKPKRVAVALGISDGISTEIVAGDVREGQDIIIESLKKSSKPKTQAHAGPPRMF